MSVVDRRSEGRRVGKFANGWISGKLEARNRGGVVESHATEIRLTRCRRTCCCLPRSSYANPSWRVQFSVSRQPSERIEQPPELVTCRNIILLWWEKSRATGIGSQLPSVSKVIVLWRALNSWRAYQKWLALMWVQFFFSYY